MGRLISIVGRLKDLPSFRFYTGLFLLSSLLVISIACNEEVAEAESFFERTPQTIDERVFHDSLVLVDSTKLLAHGVHDARNVFLHDGLLYVGDTAETRVAVFSPEDLSLVSLIGHGSGEGPGELGGLRDFAVGRGFIALCSEPERKVALYDFDGSHRGDFFLNDAPPHRLAATEDVVVVLSPFSSKEVFSVVSSEGEVRIGWEQRADDTSPLAYSGIVEAADNHVYFAGISESTLRKYSLDGELLFSRATIDDVPPNTNYATFEGSTHTSWRYTDHAVLSSLDMAVLGDYMLVYPLHDTMGDRIRALDVYDSADGTYQKSFRMQHLARSVTGDATQIFMLEYIEEELYLMAYENPL